MKFLTYVIMAVGVFVLIVSWFQWFFRFPDTSQLFLGTIGSVNILSFAYIFENISFLHEKYKSQDYRLDSISFEMKGGK